MLVATPTIRAAEQPGARRSDSQLETRVERYTVQIAAFADPDEARALADTARRQIGPELPVHIDHRGPNYQVRVGYFALAPEVETVLTRVRELGYTDAWITTSSVRADQPVWQGPGVRTDAQGSLGDAGPGMVTAPPPALPAPAPLAPGPLAPPPSPAGRRIVAIRVSTDLVIDGRLDDAAWTSAQFVSDFQQKEERGGSAPVERTEVAFLYDDDALYVGARMSLRDPSLLHAPMSRRGDPADADRLIVSLDTYREGCTAYDFGVTAGGARIDYYQPDNGFAVRDHGFDPEWEARTTSDESGWAAEIRIAFASLCSNDGSAAVWGIDVQRVTPEEHLYAFWVVVPSIQSDGRATGRGRPDRGRR